MAIIKDGEFEYRLAIHDLDCAKKYLRGLMKGEYRRVHSTHLSNIDSATRFIHSRVWIQRPPVTTIQQVYIPLLKKAKDSLDANPKDRFSDYVKTIITYRIQNLERYCEGLPSAA